MSNNAYNNFTNQNFNELSNWLNTLNPYEFALYGALAGFLIAPTLNPNQLNSVGNWLEEIGQILLTIAAQSITVQQANSNNQTGIFDISKDDLNNIWNEINKIKSKLNKE